MAPGPRIAFSQGFSSVSRSQLGEGNGLGRHLCSSQFFLSCPDNPSQGSFQMTYARQAKALFTTVQKSGLSLRRHIASCIRLMGPGPPWGCWKSSGLASSHGFWFSPCFCFMLFKLLFQV